MKKVSIEQFKNDLKKNPSAQCVDVREPMEFAQARIENFNLYPLSQLSEKSVQTLKKDKKTYLLCLSGKRSCQAADRLEQMGFSDLCVIDGGIGAFEIAGKPVIKGKSNVWGLERQVRFAAGFLVFLGILLSFVIHPGFIGLSIFVSLGLMFAAITDTCAMGMLIAKMPWNRNT